MNNPLHIGRRTFLKGAGVSLALPFMDSLSWAAGPTAAVIRQRTTSKLE